MVQFRVDPYEYRMAVSIDWQVFLWVALQQAPYHLVSILAPPIVGNSHVDVVGQPRSWGVVEGYGPNPGVQVMHVHVCLYVYVHIYICSYIYMYYLHVFAVAYLCTYIHNCYTYRNSRAIGVLRASGNKSSGVLVGLT